MNASNNCKLIGRFTKSPFDLLKKLDNGNFFLQVSLVVKSQNLDKTGAPYDRTDYPQITFWNQSAENVARNFLKGDLIEVTAQVQTRRFLAADQKTWRYATEFLVDSIKLVSSAGAQSAEPTVADSEATRNPTKTCQGRGRVNSGGPSMRGFSSFFGKADV